MFDIVEVSMWLFLLGCPWVSYDTVSDVDSDDVLDSRYGGRDCDDNDPTVGDCDADQDGVTTFDGDCDDNDPNRQGPTDWFTDEDGDGFGTGPGVRACDAPEDTAARDGDCNDERDDIHPDAVEQCDVVDRNCDGDFTLGAQPEWFLDEDGDGYGGSIAVPGDCTQPSGAVGNAFDCNDDDEHAHPIGTTEPDYTEVCDGVDNDCNGDTDAEDAGLINPIQVYADEDRDGFGNPLFPSMGCSEPQGFADNGLDCDDDNGDINPGVNEICDEENVDEDCNGLSNNDDPNNNGGIFFPDADIDGVGVLSEPTRLCVQEIGFTSENTLTDCNDLDSTISSDVPWYADNDGDGFGTDVIAHEGCFPPLNVARVSGDCDDTESGVHPNASEVCNEVDDDCNGQIDDDALGGTVGFRDQDGDGFGENGSYERQCGTTSPRSGDCNDEPDDPDADPDTVRPSEVFPGALEVCNGIDDDCDGLSDEADPSLVFIEWYPDRDFDGLGDREASPVLSCEPPPGMVANKDDCDDGSIGGIFARFTVDPSDTSGDLDVVPTLEAAYTSPLRCGVPLTIDLKTDVVLTAEAANLIVQEDRIHIRSYEGERHTFQFSSEAPFLQFIRPVELERLDLVPVTDVTPIRLLFNVGLTLRNVHMTNMTLGSVPLMQVVPFPFDPTGARVELEDVTITDSTIGGLLHTDGPSTRQDVHLTRTHLQNVTVTDYLVHLEDNQCDVSDSCVSIEGEVLTGELTIRDSVFENLTTAGPAFLTQGGVDVEVERSRFVDSTVAGPLFCLEGTGCALIDGTDIRDLPVYEDAFHTPEFRLTQNEFLRVHLATEQASQPWLFFQTYTTGTLSVGNIYRDDGDAPNSVTIRGDMSANATQEWSITSIRDRYDNVGRGFTGFGVDMRFYEGVFSDLEWQQFGGDGSQIIVESSLFLDSNIQFRTNSPESSFYRNIHHYTLTNPPPIWPYEFTFLNGDSRALPVGSFGSIYGVRVVTPAEPPVSWNPISIRDQSFVDFIELDSDTLLAFGEMPARWILPVPREANADFLTGRAPPADPQGDVGPGIDWTIDLDDVDGDGQNEGDGLPDGWAVFHLTTFECRRDALSILDPIADPDEDGLTNLEEYEAGTWPCVADSDSDGQPDGTDPNPLDQN